MDRVHQGSLRGAAGGGYSSEPLFDYAADFASLCFVVAMLFALARLFLGPRAQDRVLAFDALYITGLLTLLTLGIRARIDGVFRHGAAHRVVRLRRIDRTGQVPAARRGDRAMTEIELSALGSRPGRDAADRRRCAHASSARWDCFV